tara:strand:- start:1135 stop:1278 length:144 start_codon:yes stop_codon:yes gene_type:complete
MIDCENYTKEDLEGIVKEFSKRIDQNRKIIDVLLAVIKAQAKDDKNG